MALFLYNRVLFIRRRPKNVPIAVGTHWLLGLVVKIAEAAKKKEHLDFLTAYFQRFGRKTFAVRGPSFTARFVILTMDRRNVEHVLKTNFNNYPKGPFMRDMFTDLLGNGIFNADGEQWLNQRKTTSHMFTATLFKEHIWNVVRRNARKVRSILTVSPPNEVVDMFSLMNRFTLDSIGEIGFGRSIGSLEDPSSPFLGSFDRAQQNTFRRFLDPRWLVERLFGYGTERELRADIKLLDDFSRTIVRDLCAELAAREQGSKGNVAWADIEVRKSFVGLFVQDAHRRGEQLSETYLRDLVLNFLIAGRDTTAQCLAWTFYCLAQRPEVEDKARKEILEVCGEDDPKYEHMKRMPFLTAVLSESLRLFPSVPIDMKWCLEADTWPDGTQLAAETPVFYVIHSMNRDPDVWGADADSFRPERWLEMETKPDGYAFPVFNAGPRECLGKRMAMIEMQGLLAMVLPHVSLRLAVPAEQIKNDAQLTLGMSSGLPCFVTRHAKPGIDKDLDEASTESRSKAASDAFTEGSVEVGNEDEA